MVGRRHGCIALHRSSLRTGFRRNDPQLVFVCFVIIFLALQDTLWIPHDRSTRVALGTEQVVACRYGGL
jgi:hypothetical protein